MMHMLGDIPDKVGLAISGGVDSMVLLDFLMRGRKDVTLYHYHHGTPHADHAYEFVLKFSTALNLPLVSSRLEEPVPANRSSEEFWRERRYQFLDAHDGPIFLAHHLDDVVETWLFSSFHGTPKLVPYARNNCFRPMLQVTKEQIYDWAERHNVPYVTDPSNENTGYMRNKIRHEIVPKVLEVNPGIHKVLAKRVRMQYDDWTQLDAGNHA